jgi:hypothetical protein
VTAVSVIATSAPTTLKATAIVHLPCLCTVSADRHQGVSRLPASLLESDEGAIPFTFYRHK